MTTNSEYDRRSAEPAASPSTVATLTQQAAQGDAKAQYNLGVMYDKGEGGERNLAKARELYTQAAAQGYAPAQYNLGVMYDTGEGGECNLAKARELYTQAAAQGASQDRQIDK
jgi:TPR repeat protein